MNDVNARNATLLEQGSCGVCCRLFCKPPLDWHAVSRTKLSLGLGRKTISAPEPRSKLAVLDELGVTRFSVNQHAIGEAIKLHAIDYVGRPSVRSSHPNLIRSGSGTHGLGDAHECAWSLCGNSEPHRSLSYFEAEAPVHSRTCGPSGRHPFQCTGRDPLKRFCSGARA